MFWNDHTRFGICSEDVLKFVQEMFWNDHTRFGICSEYFRNLFRRCFARNCLCDPISYTRRVIFRWQGFMWKNILMIFPSVCKLWNFIVMTGAVRRHLHTASGRSGIRLWVRGKLDVSPWRGRLCLPRARLEPHRPLACSTPHQRHGVRHFLQRNSTPRWAANIHAVDQHANHSHPGRALRPVQCDTRRLRRTGRLRLAGRSAQRGPATSRRPAARDEVWRERERERERDEVWSFVYPPFQQPKCRFFTSPPPPLTSALYSAVQYGQQGDRKRIFKQRWE